MEDDRADLLSRRIGWYRHRGAARGRAHRRRNGTAAVHQPRQFELVDQPGPTDVQPASDHLPIRRLRLPGLGATGMGWRITDHHRRARPQRPGTVCIARREMTLSETMSQSQSQSFGGVQARAVAANISEARIAIRNLDFFYGSNQALKHINLDFPN